MNTCAKFHTEQFWQYSTPGTYTIRLRTLHDEVQPSTNAKETRKLCYRKDDRAMRAI